MNKKSLHKNTNEKRKFIFSKKEELKQKRGKAKIYETLLQKYKELLQKDDEKQYDNEIKRLLENSIEAIEFMKFAF